MATRRSRIKGILNIPQRRKPEAKAAEDASAPGDPGGSSSNAVDADQSPKEREEKLQEPSPEADCKTETQIVDKSDQKSRDNCTFAKPLVQERAHNQNDKVKSKTDTSNQIPAVASSNELSIAKDKQTSHPTPPEASKPAADCDYITAPLSPTKLLNRARIKPVPCLGQRRTSTTLHGSASESEDDGKKMFKRIRTESACSAVSQSTEPAASGAEPSFQKSKEFNSIIQRKVRRTDQCRRMAEARRNFVHKFGNQPPDKQKLTMFDLLFYNPVANPPMSQKTKKQQPAAHLKENETEKTTDSTEELDKNDETHPKENAESDEENAIPAPQIKIGANGEIVIDEKSLVIENAETKKSREQLQNSAVIDGDFDTGYGIYKKKKRSKDWSKVETVLFYKALNTLGTDFSLMTELFSERTRRELKMKFKKEERVNRLLINKALTQPVQYDITELQKEAEYERKRLEEQVKKRNCKEKKDIIPYNGRKTVKRQIKKKSVEPKPKSLYTKLEKGIASVCESDSEDDDSDTSSVHQEMILKPTRSGRVPKPSKQYTFDEIVPVRNDLDSAIPLAENLSTLQPGSIMIVSCQTPSGQPTFKVFMVTPSQNSVPINLTQDMLNNLTQNASNSNTRAISYMNNDDTEQKIWPLNEKIAMEQSDDESRQNVQPEKEPPEIILPKNS